MHDPVSRAAAQPEPASSFLLLLLPALVLASIAIHFPMARHNAPIAMNVDDRISFSVLVRFHQGSANPKFFMYPTLFYYLTYAVTALFGFSRMLLAGHLFNLALLGLTAWLSALFCIRQFQSRIAAGVAACAVLLSPTLVASGMYLCTDVLLAAMTILSLDYLMLYFRSRSSRDWLYAMLAVGCTVASKYTGAVLFIVYAIGEVIEVYRNRRTAISDQPVGSRFSRPTLYAGLLAVSIAAAVAALFFPVQSILHFVALHRTNMIARTSQDYLVFLNHLRRLFFELSAGAILLLLASWRSRTVYECVALKKLYYGFFILLGVCLVTTPYAVLDPIKFVYDIGALLRANVVVIGNHQQWGEYWHWLVDSENRALIVLGVVGLGLMIYRLAWIALTPILFATLHGLAICTAHLGFARYLDPILPLLYCAAGLFVSELWRGVANVSTSKSGILWRRVAMGVLAIAILSQMIRRTILDDRAAAEHNAFYTAYAEVLKVAPSIQESGATNGSSIAPGQGRVLYAGFTPYLELSLAGLKTQEVSWPTLSHGPIGQQLTCSDLLILNDQAAAINHVSAAQDSSLQILSDDPRGEGQMVVRRRDCSSPSASTL